MNHPAIASAPSNQTDGAAITPHLTELLKAIALINSCGGTVAFNNVQFATAVATTQSQATAQAPAATTQAAPASEKKITRVHWTTHAPFKERIDALSKEKPGCKSSFTAPAWCNEKQVKDYIFSVRRYANDFSGKFQIDRVENGLQLTRV